MLHRSIARAWAARAAAAVAVSAGQATAACDQQPVDAIFGGLGDLEYYAGAFAQAKDRSRVIHTSTGKPVFHRRPGVGLQTQEATFGAMFESPSGLTGRGKTPFSTRYGGHDSGSSRRRRGW